MEMDDHVMGRID